MSGPLFTPRPGQAAVFRHISRTLYQIMRRQYGKSYGLGAWALDRMMADVVDVIFCSASVRLGMENIRKEVKVWWDLITRGKQVAQQKHMRLTTSADNDRGALLDLDAVCDLFESQKLETKIWHDRTRCSRSIVVAPNPDTAVGWTGTVCFDEVGRMPEFKEMLESMEPIIASSPTLCIRGVTTPPPDDAHHSYELLAPPPDLKFPVNPAGNFYRSTAGVLVHRLDAWDGYAGGVPLYHKETGAPMTPEEHRETYLDKDAWDRNYGCRFLRGGAAAVSLTSLYHAQAAGAAAGCLGVNVTDALELAA
ncbi:MAG TPA: hypothetical protein PLU30_27285 [Verrucomicrobiae bacterium]|nr:hypothetical protein [Verrucomicrobiae bacterium]